jgi:glycosyltransferase involved in cell wall biosynthesis
VATLAEAGHQVDYICLRCPGQPLRERAGAVTTWRLPAYRRGPGAAGILMAYGSFFLLAAVLVTALHVRRRFRVVQVNTLPDALVFAATVPRLLGARILLDLQEPMPEFFATRFGTSMRHPVVRAIEAIEQASIRFAHHAITPTAQMREVFASRGAPREKITVVMDGADERIFHPLPSLGPDPGGFSVISHGTIEEWYGLDAAVEAVAVLRDEIPELQLLIYGKGSDEARLRALTARLGLQERVHFSEGFVPIDDLLRAIATSHVGLVALKRDPFRDVTLAGKMFEFIVMGVPMAVSRTRSVEESFPPGCFESFESGDVEGLAAALRTLRADPEHRARLAVRARTAAEPYRWVRQREHYLGAVDDLLGASGGVRPQGGTRGAPA